MALWSHDFIKPVADWLFTQKEGPLFRSNDMDAVLDCRPERGIRIVRRNSGQSKSATLSCTLAGRMRPTSRHESIEISLGAGFLTRCQPIKTQCNCEKFDSISSRCWEKGCFVCSVDYKFFSNDPLWKFSKRAYVRCCCFQKSLWCLATHQF